VAAVSYAGVGKVYEDGTRAVRDLDLDVADGEFVVFVGPSGCGKTTALRMLAGLEDVSEGEIRIGTTVVNELEPRRRDIAMVFQNYALYPHMTVMQNMGFGLKVRGTPKDDIRRRVQEIAGVLGLSDLLDRKPANLSGGQRQRVAMGRAIVRSPQTFLMDEPLSNLDAKLRVQMRSEIVRIQRELNATTIYVTHDQVEAMTMGDRVVVLRKGELQQVAPPAELYDRPRNLFVASFIGSPAMTLVQGRIRRDADRLVCEIGEQSIALGAGLVRDRPALEGYVGRQLAVGVRPEDLQAAPDAAEKFDGRLRGRVRAREVLGSEALVHLDVDVAPVLSAEVLEVAADVDDAAAAGLRDEAAQRCTTFVARFDRSAPAPVGEALECAVATANLHFFDLETGDAITR
jgi:multiple sugar transport system ATP-binding protein